MVASSAEISFGSELIVPEKLTAKVTPSSRPWSQSPKTLEGSCQCRLPSDVLAALPRQLS